MPDPGIAEVMVALADQIQAQLAGTADPVIDGLNVYPLMTFNPTPPAIDIYPADPFQEQTAYGIENAEVFFTVRARVSTAEHQGGQELLLSMMDPRAEESVAQAIVVDRTLGGQVGKVQVDPPTDYQVFLDPGPDSGALLGCTWRTRVVR